MKTIILASNNKHKIQEFREMLKNVQVLSLEDINFVEDIEENGKTFLENALTKCKAVKAFAEKKGLHFPIFADDSGLCVNALNGEPGVFSARYAGEHGNNLENRRKLLKNLENVEDRRAYFCSVIVCLKEDGSVVYGEGKVYGEILSKETIDNGFGYDPIFYSYDIKKSFSQAKPEEKNLISHRALALKQLIEKLKKSWKNFIKFFQFPFFVLLVLL